MTARASDSQIEKRLMKMLAIPGKSGEEGAIAQYVISQLQTAGATATQLKQDKAQRKSPLPGECGNLILKLPGTERRPRRLFSAHLDTVPICVGCRPTRRGDRIFSANPATGLGGDNRAGCAVLLETALHILRHNLPHPPLTFLWCVQEEVGLQGAHHLQKSLLGNPHLGFNYDGGSPAKLTIGATGGYRLDIEVRGIASHAGGAPEEGVSAIAVAAIAIAKLQEEGWHGLIEQGRQTGTSNVGVISGGQATNVVTDLVQIRAEARSHDPRFRARIVKKIESAFKQAARKLKNHQRKTGEVTIVGRLDYESFRLSPQEPCVQAAAAAVAAIGAAPEYTVANGGLDANWLNLHGVPTVSLGCGQRNIHTVAEELDIPEFHQSREIAFRLATDVN